jgi:hypothetical protein
MEAVRTCASPRRWLRAKRNTVQRSSLMGIRPKGLCERRGGDVDAWVFSRVLRRTVRAQGASSGSTILVFVVQLTRGGAAGTHVCPAAALPRGYLLSGLQPEERVPVERRAGGGDWQPAK